MSEDCRAKLLRALAVVVVLTVLATVNEPARGAEKSASGGAVVNQAADGLFGLYLEPPLGATYIDGIRSKEVSAHDGHG